MKANIENAAQTNRFGSNGKAKYSPIPAANAATAQSAVLD